MKIINKASTKPLEFTVGKVYLLDGTPYLCMCLEGLNYTHICLLSLEDFKTFCVPMAWEEFNEEFGDIMDYICYGISLSSFKEIKEVTAELILD